MDGLEEQYLAGGMEGKREYNIILFHLKILQL